MAEARAWHYRVELWDPIVLPILKADRLLFSVAWHLATLPLRGVQSNVREGA